MNGRAREIYVPVVLPVPVIGVLLWGLALAVALAAVLAVAVCTSDFSDGTSTVPTTLGDCAPFCAMRSEVAHPSQVGEQR